MPNRPVLLGLLGHPLATAYKLMDGCPDYEVTSAWMGMRGLQRAIASILPNAEVRCLSLLLCNMNVRYLV